MELDETQDDWAPRVSELFHLGKLGELAVLSQEARQPTQWSNATAHWMVGSLALTGRPAVAEKALRAHRGRLSSGTLAACRFFLAVGYTTCGRHERARRYILKNFAERFACRSLRARFFSNQGLAFLFYYQGHLNKALAPASRALDIAGAEEFPLGRMMASELKGHVLVLLGNYTDGVACLEASADLAKNLSNARHENAVGISLALYQARFASKPTQAAKVLNQTLQRQPFEDVFGRAALHLELARQKIRLDEYPAARSQLWQARQVLETSSQGRYQAALALRCAEYANSQGEAEQAVMHLDHADRWLDCQTDRLLIAEVCQARIVALSRLGARRELHKERQRLRDLAQETGDDSSRSFLQEFHPRPERPSSQKGLNHRQIRILRYLETHEFVDVSACRQMFQVSDVTACRDLSSLAKKQLVDRVGKARATRYTMPQPVHGDALH